MSTFVILTWPGVDLYPAELLRRSLLDAGEEEAPEEAADHVLLMLPTRGDEQDAPVSLSDARVIPIAAEGHPSNILEERSQIIFEERALGSITERLRGLMRVHGDVLVEYGVLKAAADAWAEDNRPTSALLRGPELSKAANVALAANAAGISDPVVHGFVSAAIRHQRRLSRRQGAIAGIGVVALVAVSIVMLHFRTDAQEKERVAIAARHVSTSVRLGIEAERHLYIGEGLNPGEVPDLAELLALEALESSHTAEAERAARLSLTASPPHISVRLRETPRALAASGDGTRLAVLYGDGGIDIYDDALEPVERIPADGMPSGKELIALNADGSCVARADGTILTQICGAEVEVAEFESDLVALRWRGETVVAVTRDANVRLLDGDVIHELYTADLEPPIFAAGFTPDLSRIVLSSSTTSVLMDLVNGEVRARGPGGNMVALHPDGQEYLVRMGSAATYQVASSSVKTETELGSTPDAYLLKVYSAAPYIVSGQIDSLCPVADLIYDLDNCFVAHRGGVTDAAWLGSGRTATVGEDRYLRLWNATEALSYPDPKYAKVDPMQQILNSALLGYEPDYTRQIRWNGAMKTLVTLDPRRGTVDHFNRDLERTRVFRLGPYILSPSTLSAEGRSFARLDSSTLRCFTYEEPDRYRAALVVKDKRFGVPVGDSSRAEKAIFAPAEDCSTVLICDRSEACQKVTKDGVEEIVGLAAIGYGYDADGIPFLLTGPDQRSVAGDIRTVPLPESAVLATGGYGRMAWIGVDHSLVVTEEGGGELLRTRLRSPEVELG